MRLRIAVQKSGRLSEDGFELLKKCGLNITESERRLLYRVSELPMDILTVRSNDIPGFVDEGVCDLGIIGKNTFQEVSLASGRKLNADVILPLGFSKCRLSIAIPDYMSFSSFKDLQGLSIATSYPALLRKYLVEQNVEAEIVKMEGSVEVAPHLEIADAICDIVSTGVTLQANGLIEAEVILKSEAILIGGESLGEEKERIVEQLVKRIIGVLSAKESKYVMLNAPTDNLQSIIDLLPGADLPTIIPLGSSDKSAVHVVCLEPVFWETMEKLKKVGATNILVVPIEKMLR